MLTVVEIVQVLRYGQYYYTKIIFFHACMLHSPVDRPQLFLPKRWG